MRKYRVSIDDLENIAIPSMISGSPDVLVVIDAIGKMECLSPLFRKKLVDVLDSHPLVLGTIALKGNSFMKRINKDDVDVIEVTPVNRDSLVSIICKRLELL